MICSIDNLAALNKALDSGLYQTIYECFSVAPYHEKITREKLSPSLIKYIHKGVLLVACKGEIIIGHVAATPLQETHNNGELSLIGSKVLYHEQEIRLDDSFWVQETKYRIKDFQYIADVGVAYSYRQQGIGTQLCHHLFDHFSSSQPYVVRTVKESDYLYILKFYQKLGFKRLPVVQTLQYKGNQSEIQSSERLICVKLPQNNISESAND